MRSCCCLQSMCLAYAKGCLAFNEVGNTHFSISAQVEGPHWGAGANKPPGYNSSISSFFSFYLPSSFPHYSFLFLDIASVTIKKNAAPGVPTPLLLCLQAKVAGAIIGALTGMIRSCDEVHSQTLNPKPLDSVRPLTNTKF